MCRKLIYLVAFVFGLGLGLTRAANAGPAGHWTFDEGVGDVAHDSSGNNNDGTLLGNPAWVTGSIGSSALNFDDSDDIIIIGDNPSLDIEDALTISLWVNTPDVVTPNHMVTKQPSGTAPDNYPGNYEFRVKDNTIQFLHQTSEGTDYSLYISTSQIATGEWHHAAVSVEEGGLVEFYIDGIPAGSTAQLGTFGMLNDEPLRIGGRKDDHFFNGILDDVYIYDRALTANQIESLSNGIEPVFTKAERPAPEDGVLHAETWVNLGWHAGEFAVSHDVYFGDNFDDVNAGVEGTFVGNQTETKLIVGFLGFACPDGLAPGTTYYWRIDEVDPTNTYKGSVWSFTVPPRTAYDPDPADGGKFIDPNVELSWTTGFRAKLHTVYFGDNFDDVNNAVVGFPQTTTTYTPGTLELEKTYYWRVDEFDGAATHKGDVLSFKTMPVIPITDPNLVGWWTLDEGMGATAVDWSGHGNHATLFGPKWAIPGLLGNAALNFGGGGYVAIQNLHYNSTDNTGATVCAWIRTNISVDQYIASFDRDNYWRLEINGNGAGDGQVGWDVMTSSGQVDYGSVTRVDDGLWHHVCGVFDNGRLTIYIDGFAEPSASGGTTFGSGNTRYGFICANSEAASFNGSRGGGTPVSGDIDELRIYNKALTVEEIMLAMRGDPLLAWGPNPSQGSKMYIRDATPLNWLAGDNASQHDVYFGTDRDAVADADASDTTGIYRGRQGVTIYTPPEVEWGGGPYYWRIDEYNTDATISKGNVWSFTVADFIVIDDIEDYNDYPPDEIFSTWIDGWEVPTNGSMAGHAEPPFAETTIVHGGSQSMPLYYENNFKYSEAAMTLVSARDWTEEGVGVLSLWFYGDAANAAERMYVALNGSAVVYHDNPDAALIDEWTEWTIDLQAFTGVNLANVNTIAIGFGDKNNLQAGGSGLVFFDDIRLYRPAPLEPEPAP